MNLSEITRDIRARSIELGFDACGFAKAEPLDEEARRLEEWLMEKRHGNMQWMENHFEKRTDPARLVPGTNTVISVIGSYHFPENRSYDKIAGLPKIAKYARGRDYHRVFKKKLFKLFDYIKERVGEIHGRVFVDSAPVLEKAWAVRAGLGWIGKNSNLLTRHHGSFILIGEIFVDLSLPPDSPVTDHCGSCTRCIDACPTDAIYHPYRVDGSRCISYLTIELKEQIPDEYREKLGEWMFGCDICQDVCPWNRKADNGTIDDLKPRGKMISSDLSFWETLDNEEYQRLFNGTPVRRAKLHKFQQNAQIVVKNLRKKSFDRRKK